MAIRRVSKSVRNRRWNKIHAVRRGVRAALSGPSYHPNLALWYDFETNPSLAAVDGYGPTLSITRATDATFSDWEGVVRTVDSNEARFPGARRVQNLLLQSNDFETTWTPSAITLNTGLTAPDGTLTATGFESTSSTSRMNQSITLEPNRTYCFSFYAKAGDKDFVYASARNFTTPADDETFWDVSTGVVGHIGSSDSHGIEDQGDGWYRCWMVFTLSSADVIGVMRIGVSAADLIVTAGATGADSAIVWHSQLEDVTGQADPAPSEYVATTTTAESQWYATKRRTNLVLQSSDLDHAGWLEAKTGAATITYPTVDSVTCSAAAGEIAYIHKNAFATEVGKVYTASALVSNWTGTGGRYNIYVAAGAHGVVAGGDGYMSVTWTATSTSTKVRFGCGANTSELNDVSMTLSEIQIEPGSTRTAYIPTTTTLESSDFDTAINPTGLLVEEARTNICLQSEDFSTTWSNGANATTNANDTTAPDGTVTATQLIDTNGGGTGAVEVEQAISNIGTSTQFCLSAFFKKDGLDWCQFRIQSLGAATPVQWFDLTNGVVGASGADIDDSGIEDYGNGWYRCWVVFTTDSVDDDATYKLRVAEADGDSVVDLDGTSSIFMWGVQLEAGAFPTSYIPTAASTVTRNSEVVTTSDISWYSDDEGSFYAYGTYPYTGTHYMYSFEDSNNDRFIHYMPNVAGTLRSLVTGNGDASGQMDETGFSQGDVFRSVITAAPSDADVYVDGVLADSANGAATLPRSSVSPTFNVGSRAGGANDRFWNSTIKEIRYYNVQLEGTVSTQLSTDGDDGYDT